MGDAWEKTKRLVKGKPESQMMIELKQEHMKVIDRKNEELMKARRRYETDMSEKDYEMRMKERQSRAEMEQKESAHANKIEDLHARHAYETTKATEKHEEKMREIEGYLNSVMTNAQREKQQAEERIKRMNAEHANAIEELKQTRDVQEDQLIADHRQRTQRMQQDMAQINAALLTRDDEIYRGLIFATKDLPRSPDEKVRAQFTEIQQMVESLSRLQWKPGQRVWTDEAVPGMYGQQGLRQLRKAILQDIIWTLLFHHLFCSPFRVFGEEGHGTNDHKGLEQEWNEQCGRDSSSTNDVYTWPVPSVQAERWRYMTVKECREALIKPVPSQWDPRARLKTGFKNSLDELVDALKQELGDIVDLAVSDLQVIERLAKRSAATWLEFQMHRCRIVIVLTGSSAKSTAEKIDLLQSGTLALTTSPWVGRHGNGDGVELESFTVISDGAGESITLP